MLSFKRMTPIFPGYSDPFCEVKMKETRIFRTGVKKKTLSPTWNESVTFTMSEDSGMLEIVRKIIDTVDSRYLEVQGTL